MVVEIQDFIDNKTSHPLPSDLIDNSCVEVENLVNKNDQFIDYFQSNKHDSIMYIVGITYYDKILNKRVHLNFKENLNASLMDWICRGHPQNSIELTVRTEKKNNDDIISVLPDKTFKFDSTSVIDQFGQRLNSQLPSRYGIVDTSWFRLML